MRGLLRNLAAALLSVAVALAVGEGWMRLLAARSEAVLWSGERKALFNPYRPDARLGWALRPGWTARDEAPDYRITVRTNALGLRGPEAAPLPPAGVQRVLVLGDSFAFGYGVEDEESFPRRLEARWRAEGRAVEVLNAAVPGYSADHHLVVLRERGFALAPDLVLVALCENDVDDLGWSRHALGPDRLPARIHSLRRLVDENGRLRYVNEDRVPLPEAGPLSTWLAARSHLYNWLRFNGVRTWVGWSARREDEARQRAAGPPPEGPIEALPAAEIARGLASGNAFRHRYHRFLVDAIRAEAAARGVPVRFVVTGGGPGPLATDCAAAPDCFDAAALLPRDVTPSAYLPVDGHWSPEGHHVVSDALADWLAAQGAP
jgi:lysophospholipase L1-like esterase